jgi:hypothetical protein
MPLPQKNLHKQHTYETITPKALPTGNGYLEK